MTISCDLAIVGGGLAGGLIALALRRKRPDLDLKLIEAGDRLGGNHIWSFFAGDVAAAHHWLVAPLVTYSWRGYDVAFPRHRRSLTTPYYSIDSERFDVVIREALGPGQLVRDKALGVGHRAIVLASGERVEAAGVIDARGAADLAPLDLGWQKFLGRTLDLACPHERLQPMIMDATVEQIDGYRFIYTLPFSATTMFVEDTYYADTPEIDAPAFGARIEDYALANGWPVRSVGREESGVLPVALGGDFDAYWRGGGARIPKAGLRAGLFHPTTGYSLPDAVRIAIAVAEASDLASPALHDLTHGMAKAAWVGRGFYRMLDAMLFKAAEPDQRYRVLERFYRLDTRLIGRFYAARSTALDRLRILAGRPPVPIGAALRAIR